MIDFLLGVRCFTFQQANYIKDTMDGFCIQQTNFPYVCFIIDDASKDGEQGVILRYIEDNFDLTNTEVAWKKSTEDGEYVFAQHTTNKNCFFLVLFLKKNLYGIYGAKTKLIAQWNDQCKYQAICEGDDYWIDPYKLQKQVDILEADESLMLTCSNRRLVDMDGNTLEVRKAPLIPDKQSCRITMRDYFHYNLAYPTASVLYRNNHRKEVLQKAKHMANPYLGDWTMWIALHCFGDCYYIDEPLSAYRVNPTSLTHTQWVKDRVGRIKMEFDLQPRVADVLPDEYADIAADLRNTKWVWLPLAKAYFKNKQYVRMMGALIVYFIKNPRNIGPVLSKVWHKVLKKLKK